MSPTRDPDAGFTLIEALAALTVAVLALGALASLTHSTARNVIFAESRLGLTPAVRRIYAALPSRKSPPSSSQPGAASDGYRWRMDVRPYRAPDMPGSALGWRPDLIAIEVEDVHGAKLSVNVVRLAKGAPP